MTMKTYYFAMRLSGLGGRLREQLPPLHLPVSLTAEEAERLRKACAKAADFCTCGEISDICEKAYSIAAGLELETMACLRAAAPDRYGIPTFGSESITYALDYPAGLCAKNPAGVAAAS